MAALFAINANQLRDVKIHFIDQLVEHYPDARESILMQMQYDVLAKDRDHFFQLFKEKLPGIDKDSFTILTAWSINRGQPLWVWN